MKSLKIFSNVQQTFLVKFACFQVVIITFLGGGGKNFLSLRLILEDLKGFSALIQLSHFSHNQGCETLEVRTVAKLNGAWKSSGPALHLLVGETLRGQGSLPPQALSSQPAV